MDLHIQNAFYVAFLHFSSPAWEQASMMGITHISDAERESNINIYLHSLVDLHVIYMHSLSQTRISLAR